MKEEIPSEHQNLDVEELVSRKKLLKCVANLDVEELGVVMLSFLQRYSTMPRYANMPIKLAQKVVESRIDDLMILMAQKN